MDPIQFGKQIGALVRDQVAKAIGSVADRLSELEQRFADLPTPKDGTSVTVEDVRPMVEELVAGAVSGLPAAKDGEDGTSVKAEDVLPALQQQLRTAIAEIPAPKDGKGVTVEEVIAAVLPALKAMLESMQSTWALDFERRAQETFQRAAERLPAPQKGKDGIDGFSLDDFGAELAADGRTVVLSFVHGDRVVRKELVLPVVLDRGVFKEGEMYSQGDAVTFGGSLWIARKMEPDGKPGLSDDWRLAVKKGRDGKHGDPGKDFRPPAPVKVGGQ